MRLPAAFTAAALLATVSCRTAGPVALPADTALSASAFATVLAIRDEAWGPRRFKALFRGEISSNGGLSIRGYLALFWDGETLTWSASVPLAGSPRSGTIRRSGGGDTGQLFPGRLAATDVLAALFGVPEELPSAVGALVKGDRVELKLPSGEGRAVLVSRPGGVTGLSLPGDVRVEISPGAGVPRRIEVRGPEGRALLTLESYGAWPEGEEVPKG